MIFKILTQLLIKGVWTLALNKGMHMQAYSIRLNAFVLMKNHMEPSRMKQSVTTIVLEIPLPNVVATG